MSVCVSVCLYVCLSVCLSVCLYVCMYACMNGCVCVCSAKTLGVRVWNTLKHVEIIFVASVFIVLWTPSVEIPELGHPPEVCDASLTTRKEAKVSGKKLTASMCVCVSTVDHAAKADSKPHERFYSDYLPTKSRLFMASDICLSNRSTHCVSGWNVRLYVLLIWLVV